MQRSREAMLKRRSCYLARRDDLESGFRAITPGICARTSREDIAFAKAVQTTRANEAVYHEATSRGRLDDSNIGTFNSRKIDSTGVELMVLTKTRRRVAIRAIHWSSIKRELSVRELRQL